MGKEGVEMGFAPQMENVPVVGVVDVRKDAEHLAVHVFGRGRKRGGEFLH